MLFTDPEENTPAYSQLSQPVHENLVVAHSKVLLCCLTLDQLIIGDAF